MKKKVLKRMHSGAVAVPLLVFLALLWSGPVHQAGAQQNPSENDSRSVIETTASKTESQSNRENRSGSMAGYFDPQSGGLDVPHGTDLQVTDLIELPVVDERGEDIGEIEDVIMGENDTVLAVIETEGFLGMGEDLVTVPVSELEMGENYTRAIYSSRQNLGDRSPYTGGETIRRTRSRNEQRASGEGASRTIRSAETRSDRQARRDRYRGRSQQTGQAASRRGTWEGYQALVGTTVVNRRGEAIGEVENVLAGSGGEPARAVVSFGGFLGLGDTEVLVSLDKFQMMPRGDFIRYKGTEEALENEPEYDAYEYRQYGYTPRWPYGQPYGYPRAYRYTTRDTPPEFRNRYDPYPYRWENYTMYDELPSYDRYGREGGQRPLGYWDRRANERDKSRNLQDQEVQGYYDPEPGQEARVSAGAAKTTQGLVGRKVQNEQGIVIGTVDDLMTNRKGEPVAVISVDRFTGGSGEKLIGVPISDLDEIPGGLRYPDTRREIRNQESIPE